MALKRLQQFALGQLDTVDHRLEAGFPLDGLTLGRLRQGVERAPEIVGRADHITGKFRNRVGALILQFAFGTAAQVFHFRQGTEQPILQIGIFPLQRLETLGIDVAGFGRVGRGLIVLIAHRSSFQAFRGTRV